MHRSALATLMLAALSACASAPPSAPDEDPHATLDVIGHHCDGGQGIDAIAIHVDKPGVAVLRWSNKNVCGDPA